MRLRPSADPLPYQATDAVRAKIISVTPVQHDGLTVDDFAHHVRRFYAVNAIHFSHPIPHLCRWRQTVRNNIIIPKTGKKKRSA